MYTVHYKSQRGAENLSEFYIMHITNLFKPVKRIQGLCIAKLTVY